MCGNELPVRRQSRFDPSLAAHLFQLYCKQRLRDAQCGGDSRLKTGYVRLEGNRVKNLVFGAQSAYRGWDIAIRGETFELCFQGQPFQRLSR